jgi:hypothetical protein
LSTVAYWRFEEGSPNMAASGADTILDSSGNNLNGTPIGGPVYRSSVAENPIPLTGQANQLSLDFDGTDQRIFIPDNPLCALTHSLTVEAYINVGAFEDRQHQILIRADDRVGLDPYQLYVQNNYVYFAIDSESNDRIKVGAAIPGLNQWIHVAGTLNDGTGALAIYVNGVLGASTVTTERPLAMLDPTANPGLSIGNVPSSNYFEYFNGLIDEVRISDKALAPSQFLDARATVTYVTSSPPSVYGQPVTFTANVTSGGGAVSTGTVTFQEGNTILTPPLPVSANGQASFQISTLTAGPHTITAYYSGSASHQTSSGSVTETVNQAPLLVTADDKTRIYAQANSAFTVHYTGFVLGQDPSVLGGNLSFSTPATTSTDVGNYPITPSGLTSSNYAIKFVVGTLTVWPAPLLVVAANASRPYGAPNPILTDTLVGIQNNDPITATCYTDATLASPAGNYSIVPIPSDGGTGKLSNYAPTIVNGTLTVTPDPLLVTSLADNGPGSLRSVLANAPAGSTVHFGVYGTITLTGGPLNLTQDVTIAGPGADALTISGNQTFEVFQIGAAATVTISSLTIAQGSSANLGGGIYNDGTLTLSNTIITGNFASPRGGGIYNSPTGTLTLNQSIVSANSSTNAGGGIFNDGTLTVNASSFTGNGSTNADGGGIFNLGTLTLTCSTFSANGGDGAYGGAVRNDGPMTVQECTFANNHADLGGAFYNMGTLIVSSCTVSGNTAVAGGGGIDNGGALLARNTIFAENSIMGGTGPDLSGVLTSLGHNLFGNSRGGSGFRASDLLNDNPLLGPLQYNGGPTQTMALLPDSPALHAGDPTDAPAYDQRGPGYPRLVGGQIDIGAYEVQPGPVSPLIVTSNADDITQLGTLRYAIAHANNGDTIFITPAIKGAIVLTQGELMLNKDLTIEAGGNALAMISGNNASRVFEIASNAHVSLTYLNITEGFDNNFGGVSQTTAI